MRLGPGLERVTDGHVAPRRHRNCQPGADHSKRRHQTLPPCRATFIVRTVGVACAKKDVVHKTGSTLHDVPHDYRNRTRPRPRHRKLDEIWTIGFFRIRVRTDRHANRYVDRNTADVTHCCDARPVRRQTHGYLPGHRATRTGNMRRKLDVQPSRPRRRPKGQDWDIKTET